MVQRMEQRRERAQWSETIAQRDDPHMLDAVIGEQAFCIALKHDEPGGNEDRQKTERGQQPIGEALAKRVLHRRHEPHDAIERGVQQKTGEHRRNRRRRLAVRIRQPGMDRRQPGLRAIADEHEDEGEFHQDRIEMRVGRSEMRPEQRIRADRAGRLDRRRGEQRPHERKRDPDRADDQILPHRLEREPVRVKRDQEGAEQRRRFHADPHDAEIVRHQNEHHRRQRAQP